MKITLPIFFLLSFQVTANNNFNWPNETKAAVSLSYDDALNSQLDNAIPTLDKYDFKGSFYLILSSPVVKHRLSEWREIAANGHELGNHTINHACSGSLPGREWVPEHNDLDSKKFEEIINEVETANSFLKAIDGENIRTFTVPCTDQLVENKNYVLALHNKFVGIKSHVGDIPNSINKLDIKNTPVWAPSNQTGQELISFVKKAAEKGTMANFTFHGIGGDHLSVSKTAHQELLAYLAKNRDIYWVDTFLVKYG